MQRHMDGIRIILYDISRYKFRLWWTQRYWLECLSSGVCTEKTAIIYQIHCHPVTSYIYIKAKDPQRVNGYKNEPGWQGGRWLPPQV